MALVKHESQLADRNGNPLIGAQQEAIALAVTTTTDEDEEARAAITSIIAVLEAHGLIAPAS